jgi:hypothetical protein
MTTAPPIILRLRRAHNCSRPWRFVLTGARCELAVSSRALVTPRQLRKAAASHAIRLPPLSDRELLREVGKALAKIEAA